MVHSNTLRKSKIYASLWLALKTWQMSDILHNVEDFILKTINKNIEAAIITSIIAYFYKRDLLTQLEYLSINNDLGVRDDCLDNITLKSDICN